MAEKISFHRNTDHDPNEGYSSYEVRLNGNRVGDVYGGEGGSMGLMYAPWRASGLRSFYATRRAAAQALVNRRPTA